MRLNNAFDYEIKYDEGLETELIHIPPMLIQPFIENAIKHGLKEIQENGMLTVTITDENEMLKVKISDNGIGIDQALKRENKGHRSMALEIFTKRMSLLRKSSYKIPAPKIEDLSVSGKQGTMVELYLPIIT